MAPFGGPLAFDGTAPIGHAEEDTLNEDTMNYNYGDTDSDEDVKEETPKTDELNRKREHSPASTAGAPPKKSLRVDGGKPPVHKKPDPDDSDDARLYDLKQQGYPDEAVAQKLRDEGRIRYVAKTVASRYSRLCKIVDEKCNEKLDDELSDWHIDEDDELKESINAVVKKLEREAQRVMEKKWKLVSEDLADRLHKKKYTAKACMERFEALEDGTALKPIEIDSDQEGRAEMRANRIAEAKRLRAAAIEEVKRAEREKQAREIQKRRAREEQEFEREQSKLAKEAEKAENARIKAEKRAGKEKRKAEADANRAIYYKEIEDKKQERKKQNIIYRYLTGKYLRRPSGGRGRKKDFLNDDDEEAEMDDEEEEAFDEKYEVDDDDDIMSNVYSESDEADVEDNEDYDEVMPVASKPAKKIATSSKVMAPEEIMLSPLSILTREELDWLRLDRELDIRNGETRIELLTRLIAADQALTTEKLNSLLQTRFLGLRGKREVKIVRLEEHDARNSEAGKKGVRATDLSVKKARESYE